MFESYFKYTPCKHDLFLFMLFVQFLKSERGNTLALAQHNNLIIMQSIISIVSSHRLHISNSETALFQASISMQCLMMISSNYHIFFFPFSIKPLHNHKKSLFCLNHKLQDVLQQSQYSIIALANLDLKSAYLQASKFLFVWQLNVHF